MKRDLSRLTDGTFDLIIVGGGIHGACAAWDATLRGLSVALVEQGDFCSATSANSLKIIHGGLRYLQQLDFLRMRESIRERSLLMRLAPHLVVPLPVLVPTFGDLKNHKMGFRLALAATDLIGWDRDQIAGQSGLIPGGRVIGRSECLRLFPRFSSSDLTGGAVWFDAQVRNSERLVIEFLESAAERGAVLANYVQAESGLLDGAGLRGIRVRDQLSGQVFEVRGRVVLSAAGPWAHELIGKIISRPPSPSLAGRALAINLVARRLADDVAIGFRSSWGGDRAPIGGNHRFLFLVPWRRSTLIGTYYKPLDEPPDDVHVTEADLQEFIRECNESCPRLDLTLDDVTHYHWGLLARQGLSREENDLQLAGHARIIDHGKTDGVPGLLSMFGVKYTTGRLMAQLAIDRVVEQLGMTARACATDRTPLVGSTPRPAQNDRTFPAAVEERLLASYGDRWHQVASQGEPDTDDWTGPIADGSPMLRCEVLRAVREEMAVTLADVVLRRTDLGTERCPDSLTLRRVADLMGNELGWKESRRLEEISALQSVYRPLATSRTRQEETTRNA